jgi:hypothetical protein
VPCPAKLAALHLRADEKETLSWRGAIAPPNAEVVQVGDAIGQRAKRRGLVQSAVRQVGVSEVLVLA